MGWIYTNTLTNRKPNQPKIMTLEQIERLAEACSTAESHLNDEMQILDHQLKEVAKSNRKVITAAVRATKKAYADLANAVAESPELFVKPKSKVLHGIKVGYKKGTDTFEVASEEHTISRIRQQLPELEILLVKVEESVIKGGLKQLTDAQLIEIGVLKHIGENKPFCEAEEGDWEKAVRALIESAKDTVTKE